MDYARNWLLPARSPPITKVRLSPVTLPPTAAELRNQMKNCWSSGYSCFLRLRVCLGECFILKMRVASAEE